MSQPSTLLPSLCPVPGRRPGRRASVSVLTLVGLALRAIGLNSQLWYDEIYSLVVSISAAVARAPDHLLRRHPASALLGVGPCLGLPPWARLPGPSVCRRSSSASPRSRCSFCSARAVATTHEALLAAAFLTVSYHHVWFSQNARGYTALFSGRCSAPSSSTAVCERGAGRRSWPTRSRRRSGRTRT